MKTGLTKKEQAERTRAQILEAAIGLFSRRGFVSTTMQDIAAAIGMTPGVLYWHFDGKEAVLIAVLDELKRRLVLELQQAQTSAGARELGARELVQALIARVADVATRHNEYMILVGTVGAEATDTNTRVEAALRDAYRGVARFLEALLCQIVPRERRDAIDPYATAQLFLGLYMGGLMHQRLYRDELPLARALPVLERMLLAALLGDPVPPAPRRRPSRPRSRAGRSP